MGTTNNFNTEMFERLHIDFAKKGWRASNKRDEFPQMTEWILRQENVVSFERYLSWVEAEHEKKRSAAAAEAAAAAAAPSIDLPQVVSLPQHPTAPNKSLSLIEKQHSVPHFSTHLRDYLNVLGARRRKFTPHVALPFAGLDVYYSFKLSLEGVEGGSAEQDTVKASPLGEPRFDTVIILTGDEAESFGLSAFPAPTSWPTTAMAYVQWFRPATLSSRSRKTHNMVGVERAYLADGTTPAWSIIPLANVRQSCMLFPNFLL
ncbi:hypothetical protein BDZ89DRAFT_974912 [Hymenopellis radicata]|nr:hypothetical protein BDZ89DRAFT_974912 [Hymenopellis radicata]